MKSLEKTHTKAKMMQYSELNLQQFKYLKSLQKTHTKAKMMQYSELNLQQYLDSDCNPMTNKEKLFAFTARSHMLDL